MGVNISHLLKQVKYKQDRVLFKEACICADNNALNSCFLTLWIALVQSLKWRFIEIAKRDKESAKIIKEVTSKESKHQSVDKVFNRPRVQIWILW
jgi:hypothetical protein